VRGTRCAEAGAGGRAALRSIRLGRVRCKLREWRPACRSSVGFSFGPPVLCRATRMTLSRACNARSRSCSLRSKNRPGADPGEHALNRAERGWWGSPHRAGSGTIEQRVKCCKPLASPAGQCQMLRHSEFAQRRSLSKERMDALQSVGTKGWTKHRLEVLERITRLGIVPQEGYEELKRVGGSAQGEPDGVMEPLLRDDPCGGVCAAANRRGCRYPRSLRLVRREGEGGWASCSHTLSCDQCKRGRVTWGGWSRSLRGSSARRG
jgi:hypothetical protein